MEKDLIKISIFLLTLFVGCQSETHKDYKLLNDKKSIDLLTDIQLVESRVSSLTQWKKDSITSLLYYQLTKKYQIAQNEIDTLIKRSLEDPSESILIYEKIKKNIEKMNDTLKLN